VTREPSETRLYHPHATESHAEVRVAERPGGGAELSVWRGPNAHALRERQRLGPFSSAEVDKARASLIQGLRAQGYEPPGAGAALRELRDPSPARRAHAARRLARGGVQRAAEPLLALAERPGLEISTVVESLAQLGDARAIPLARAEAGRALASRRRAGQEALRRLLGARGEAEVAGAARLPAPLLAALTRSGAQTKDAVDVVLALPAEERGASLEALYERADPASLTVLHALLGEVDVASPHLWRHVKSVWKRAMLRADARTVGLVCWAAERRARATSGRSATVKSGYDGAKRTVRVFSRKTADYVRRRSWRWLRELAQERPAEYPFAAAAMLQPYAASDGATVRGEAGAEGCFVLHQILRGRATRFRLDARAMRFRAVPGARELAREEAFAELWDAQPQAIVRVLASARHPWARSFALDAVCSRHTGVLAEAAPHDLLGMAASDDARVVDLALAELRRRFEPLTVPLDLVWALSASRSDAVRLLGVRWLSECAPRWLLNVDDGLRFLSIPEPRSREIVVRLVSASLLHQGASERRAWAEAVAGALEGDEAAPGAHAALAEVVLRALMDDVLAICPLPRAIAWMESGSEGALAVGAQVLARKRGAFDVLGASAVLALAQDDRAAVRRAAHALLKDANEDVTRDPSTACALLESAWADSRAVGRAMLESVDVARLTLDALFVIVDVVRADALEVALDILRRAAVHLDVTEIAARLAQHPAPAARDAGVVLAHKQLRPGVVALVRVEPLLRATLLRVGRTRHACDAAFEILETRGAVDPSQAEVVVGVLSDVLRAGGLRDRERALAGLTSIALLFPRVESLVVLRGAGR
jgi:hypothetical protein